MRRFQGHVQLGEYQLIHHLIKLRAAYIGQAAGGDDVIVVGAARLILSSGGIGRHQRQVKGAAA